MPDSPASPPPRSVRYLDAVAHVRGLSRVRLAGLADALGVDADTADIFLSCMLAEGVVAAREPNGWWPVLRAADPSGVLAGSDATPIPAPATDLALARLEDALARLEGLAARARAETEAAEARAFAAARRVAELERRQRAGTDAPAEEQLATLKRLLARELHPDRPGSPAERELRETLFKQLWPLLSATERAVASR